MFNKALWLKEYKQTQGMLWGIFAALFLVLPLPVMPQLSNLEKLIAHGVPTPLELNLPGNLSPVLLFAVILLGCWQIGGERSRHQDDFTLSLPYSRSSIYLTKWGLGAATIVISLTVNFLITHLVIAASPVRSLLVVTPELWSFWAQLVPAALALYTLTLFLGVLSGGFSYQFIFSLIFAVFPAGFATLLGSSVETHRRALALITPEWYPQLFDGAMTIAKELSLFTHLFPLSTNFSVELAAGRAASLPWVLAAVDVLFILAFLAGGASLYRWNRVEYNGRLLVFPGGTQTFFLAGITVCFGLLGGWFASARFLPRAGSLSILANYWLGALLAGGLAYLGTQRLLQRPTRWGRSRQAH